jgi:hypothetical protein
MRIELNLKWIKFKYIDLILNAIKFQFNEIQFKRNGVQIGVQGVEYGVGKLKF